MKTRLLPIIGAIVAALTVAIVVDAQPVGPTGIQKVTTNSPGLLAGSGTTGNPLTATITTGTNITGTGSSGAGLAVSSSPTFAGTTTMGAFVGASQRFAPITYDSSPALGDTLDDYAPTNWSTETVHYVTAADNEGTRITGFAALAGGTVRVIVNSSTLTRVDATSFVLKYENSGSTTTNRIITPSQDDFKIGPDASVTLIYDSSQSRWLVLNSSTTRFSRITTQALNLWPDAYYASLSGTVDNWAPTADRINDNAFTGLGFDAGRLDFASQGTMVLDTTGALTITGLDNGTGYLLASSENPVRVLINIGVGTVTLKHQAAGSTAANRFSLPSNVDMVIPVGGAAIVAHTTNGIGWRLLSVSSRIDGTFPALNASGTFNLSNWIGPTALTSGATTNNWSPTGLSTASIIRATTSAGSTATLGGIVGAGAGNDIGRTILLFNAGTGTIALKHLGGGSSAANQFRLPGGVDFNLPVNQYTALAYDPAGYWVLDSRDAYTTLLTTTAGASIGGVFGTSTWIAPGALTSGSTTENWAPSGHGTASVILAQTSTSSNATLGGLTGDAVAGSGRHLTLLNFGPGTITLKHNSASSTANSNRFRNPNDVDYVVPVDGVVDLIYDPLGYWMLKGTSGVYGAGTANATTKWSAVNGLANAWPTDDGTTWGVSGKFTITEASGNTTISGTGDVTGNFNVNTNKFSVTASNGNTTVAGTLGVTGDVLVTTTKNKGTITLSGGTGTATVQSGSICTCTDTTANASVQCAVATTTLTATGTGTDVIAYLCL